MIKKEILRESQVFAGLKLDRITSSKKDFFDLRNSNIFSNNIIKANLIDKQNQVTENILSFFDSLNSFNNFTPEKVRRVLNRFPSVLIDFDGTFVEDVSLHEIFSDLVLKDKFPNSLILNYHRRIYYDFLEKTSKGKLAFINSKAYLDYQSAGMDLDLRYGSSFLGVSKSEIIKALAGLEERLVIKNQIWDYFSLIRQKLNKKGFSGKIPIICHTQNFGVLVSYFLEKYREEFSNLGFKLSKNHLALNFGFDKLNRVDKIYPTGTSPEHKSEFIPRSAFYITDDREIKDNSTINYFNINNSLDKNLEDRLEQILKLDKS